MVFEFLREQPHSQGLPSNKVEEKLSQVNGLSDYHD